jgi:hypothetical protein
VIKPRARPVSVVASAAGVLVLVAAGCGNARWGGSGGAAGSGGGTAEDAGGGSGSGGGATAGAAGGFFGGAGRGAGGGFGSGGRGVGGFANGGSGPGGGAVGGLGGRAGSGGWGGGGGWGGHGGGSGAGGRGTGGANAGGSAGGGRGGAGGMAGAAGSGAGAGGAAGAAGQSSVSYLGCTSVGGIDRIVVSKRDTARDLCLNVVLDSPGQSPQGLTLPSGFGLESASSGPATPCPTRAAGVRTSQVTGSVDPASTGATGYPTHVNVDLTVVFSPSDAGAPTSESLSAQNVDVQPGCQ